MLVGNLNFTNIIGISNEEFESNRVFDFSFTNQYDPFAMLFIASKIRSLKKRYPGEDFSLIPGANQGSSYAGHMGFYKSISKNIKIGKMPGEAKGSDTYLPIKHIIYDKTYGLEPVEE